MNVARVVQETLGLSKVACDSGSHSKMAEELGRLDFPIAKVASEAIRAMTSRIEDLEKSASITSVVTDMLERGIIDESEVAEKTAELSAEGIQSIKLASEAVKLAGSTDHAMFFDGHEEVVSGGGKTMIDSINEQLSRR